MLELLLSKLLTRLLSSYIEGLTLTNLRLGVWAGDLQLTELPLRPDALDALQLPLGATGRIGRLRIRVPWSRLLSEPIEILLEDVEVLASLRATPDPEAHDRRERLRKRLTLDAHELASGLRGADDEPGKAAQTGVLGRIGKSITDNLHARLLKIHVRFEQPVEQPVDMAPPEPGGSGDGAPLSRLACGATIEQLELRPVPDEPAAGAAPTGRPAYSCRLSRMVRDSSC